MTAPLLKRKKVFISYSHQDADWLQRLCVHLKPLERDYGIEIWVDTRIQPGSKWRDEIKKVLATTKVAVLLVSADFLASDFIAADELPPLLNAAEKEGATVLPVILSPSRFTRNPSLNQFQAVNDPSKPLIGMTKSQQEAVLVEVSEAIESSLNQSLNIETGQSLKDVAVKTYAWEKQETNQTILKRKKEIETEEQAKRYIKWRRIQLISGAVLIGVLAALIIGYSFFQYKPGGPEPETYIRYKGRVIDDKTQQIIRGAKVSVEIKEVTQVVYTDSNGVFYLELPLSASRARIRVEADGYNMSVEDVTPHGTAAEEVLTISVNPTNPTPVPKPTLSPIPRPKRPKIQVTPTRDPALDILEGKKKNGDGRS